MAASRETQRRAPVPLNLNFIRIVKNEQSHWSKMRASAAAQILSESRPIFSYEERHRTPP